MTFERIVIGDKNAARLPTYHRLDLALNRVWEFSPNRSATIGVTAERVSVKGKTNEGVDATGRGEAIAAHAVAVIVAGGRP